MSLKSILKKPSIQNSVRESSIQNFVREDEFKIQTEYKNKIKEHKVSFKDLPDETLDDKPKIKRKSKIIIKDYDCDKFMEVSNSMKDFFSS